MKSINSLFYYLLLLGAISMIGCGDDEDDMPGGGNEDEEEISQVTLTFTSESGETVTAVWLDADGEGTGAPEIGDIALAENTTYTMSLVLENTLGTEVEDITEEIDEEADDHMFFFEFTEDIFSSPGGDGNVDSRADAVRYGDEDDNGLPVGLLTTWTTGSTNTGNFRIVLKHQPDEKSETSDVNVGGTDVDITFPLSIQ